MKKWFISLLCAGAFFLTGVQAEENTVPEDTGLRISGEKIEYRDSEGNWQELSTKEDLVRAAALAYPQEAVLQEEASEITIAEDGEIIINGNATGYVIAKKAPAPKYHVTITFIDGADGEPVGTAEMDLEEGSYRDLVEAPEGYTLFSDNTLTVGAGDLDRLFVVSRNEAEKPKEKTDTENRLTILYLLKDECTLVASDTQMLADGTYTDIFTLPEGYVTDTAPEVTLAGEDRVKIIFVTPAETEEPKETAEPEAAAEPEATAEPEKTAEPETTAAPEETEKPAETAAPEDAAEPEESAVPKETAEPEETAETAEPEEPAEEVFYTVTLNYLTEDGSRLMSRHVKLTPGTYRFDDPDASVDVPKGYEAVQPAEIEVGEKDASVDVIVRKKQ